MARGPSKNGGNFSLRPKAKVTISRAAAFPKPPGANKTTRDYLKQELQDTKGLTNIGFGQTGLTGES